MKKVALAVVAVLALASVAACTTAQLPIVYKK